MIRKNSFYQTLTLLCVCCITILTSCLAEKRAILTEKHHGNYLIGNWEGKQNLTVRSRDSDGNYQFTPSPNEVPVELSITKNGEVTGIIGGATIQNGAVIVNRGPILRMLDWATDFCIQGDLAGNIFEGDSISQKSFSIPMHCNNVLLEGDLFQVKGLAMYPMCSIKLSRKQ